MNPYRPLNEHTPSRAFAWARAGLSVSAWKLVCRGEMYASLTFVKRDQSSALFRSAAGEFEIEFQGDPVAPRASVRRAGAREEFAAVRFAPGGKARIDFADSSSFRWHGPATAAFPASLTTIKGGSMLQIGKPVGCVPTAAMIEIDAEASREADMALLAGLSLFMLIQQQNMAQAQPQHAAQFRPVAGFIEDLAETRAAV